MTDTNPPQRSSSTFVTVVGWVVVTGAILIMGQQIRQDLASRGTAPDNAELKNVETQLADIKSALAATPAQGDLMAALRDEDTKVAALSQRFDAIGDAMKKPAVSGGNTSLARLLLTLQGKLLRGEPYRDELEQLAAIPAVSHEAEALAALRATAGGAPTELALRAGFDAALNGAGEKNGVATDPSLQKINNHLNGLITIKPRVTDAAPDTYAKLRSIPADASLATLEAAAQELPEAQREPFDSWLEQAAARDKALAAFSALASRLLPLAG